MLKKKRFANGSVNFEREEVKFYLDPDGTPTGVYFKVQKESNWLIEEFMLLANRRVAEYASRGGRYAKEVSREASQGKKMKGKIRHDIFLSNRQVDVAIRVQIQIP